MDYKELIDRLREKNGCHCECLRAATAIEALLAERDAAVEDLMMVGHCKTCGSITPWCADNPDSCEGYVWRGPQKGENND